MQVLKIPRLEVPEPARLFGAHLWRRWLEDQIWVSSGYLAYVTLISLIPFASVVFSILSFFPFFIDARDTLEQFIFSNFIPSSGGVVRDYILGFISNTRKTTTVGVIFLLITSILLISNIDSSINKLWRVKQQRSFVAAFSLYWLVLTLGPLFIGSSLAITSIFLSSQLAHSSGLSGLIGQIFKFLPFPLSFAGFFFLYVLVPNVKVRARDALWGAFVAAIFFEGGKQIFSIFVSKFPTYEIIYGALAAVPLLFMWVYFSWFFVLLGCLVSSTLHDIRHANTVPKLILLPRQKNRRRVYSKHRQRGTLR